MAVMRQCAEQSDEAIPSLGSSLHRLLRVARTDNPSVSSWLRTTGMGAKAAGALSHGRTFHPPCLRRWISRRITA